MFRGAASSYPLLAELMDDAEHDVLAFMGLPEGASGRRSPAPIRWSA